MRVGTSSGPSTTNTPNGAAQSSSPACSSPPSFRSLPWPSFRSLPPSCSPTRAGGIVSSVDSTLLSCSGVELHIVVRPLTTSGRVFLHPVTFCSDWPDAVLCACRQGGLKLGNRARSLDSRGVGTRPSNALDYRTTGDVSSKALGTLYNDTGNRSSKALGALAVAERHLRRT